MAHKHEFIPSPFKTVTQYENVFIKSWNKNTANAVAEVMKYIAQATNFAIKSDNVSDLIGIGVEKSK